MGKGEAIGWEMSVPCRQFIPLQHMIGDFELRFGSNDTLFIGKL
jgi:hypothetical protein